MTAFTRRRFLRTLSLSAIGAAPILGTAAALAAGAATSSSGTPTKLAFAHYMIGQGTRRRRQSRDEWRDDIRDAIRYGIDGWQFNFGRYRGEYKSRIDEFVRTLDSMGSEVAGFYFFPSFDCNKGRKPNLREVQDWFDAFYDHPNHLKVDNLPLLTVWQARHVGNNFFVNLKRRLSDTGTPISFIPWVATSGSERDLRSIFNEWTSMDGFFPWVPGKTVEHANSLNKISGQLCLEYNKTLLAGQGFAMLQVNKAPIYVNKHAAEAIPTQMIPLINGEVPNCHLLNVATWNDFGEDHHITPQPPWGPIGGDHPVHCHIGYSAVVKYYLDWWKTGSQPVLEDDSLAIFHMLQLANEGKAPFPLSDYEPDKAKDTVYATAMLRSPATISIKSGSAPLVKFEAPAGVSHMRAPASPGAQVFTLERDGVEILRHVSGEEIHSPPTKPWSWSLYSEVASTNATTSRTSNTGAAVSPQGTTAGGAIPGQGQDTGSGGNARGRSQGQEGF